MKHINNKVKAVVTAASAALLAIAPVYLQAQLQFDPFKPSHDPQARTIAMIVAFIVLSLVLVRIWAGIMNVSLLLHEPLDKVEKRKKQPYIPSVWTIVTTVACTAGLFFLSIRTMGGIAPFNGVYGTTYAAIFFGVVGLVSVGSEFLWPKARHYVFAFTVGTLVTFILLGFYKMLFTIGVKQDPFFMSLGVVCCVMAWRFLFGPWRPIVKATVLGTFIFWVAIHMLANEAPDARLARILATVVAFVPALVWCLLFMREHAQRLSLVVLMFFAGMISTAPILFYDALVRHQIEMQFFLFTIVPENFTRSSSAFVSGNVVGITGVQTTLITTLVSFMLVGLIEEVSKFWVLKRSGEPFFRSIDDVLQLGIIVAIGFAFAENVINPTYFLSFVRNYLIYPVSPQWGAFLGNVLGRAILTNMVHILSTGVIGYFFGLALFAKPTMEERMQAGKYNPIVWLLNTTLRLPKESVFRVEMMTIGMVSGIVLHGLFNFLVTLPDLLPGNPRTIGELLSLPADSPLHFIALLIVPSLFYVVGGFWILSILFYRKECIKEHGQVVHTDTFVKPQAA